MTILLPRRKFITGAAALIGYAALPKNPYAATLINPFILGGVAAATVTYTDVGGSTNTLTTFTFTVRAIGTASADRKVVVSVFGVQGSATDVSTLTVGGISASLVIAADGAGGVLPTEMWQADVPTGTTADIVITWNAAAAGCGIRVHAVTGAASAAYHTASTTASADPSVSLNVAANGVSVAFVVSNNNPTHTWTGITDDAGDATIGAFNFSSASLANTANETGRTITAAEAPDSTGRALIAASWAKA